jgi:hypothetical protein
MKPGDWFVLGQTFIRFRYEAPDGSSADGCHVLSCQDAASQFILGSAPIKKLPGAITAAEALDFLRAIFAKHGLPRRGIVLSKSLWQSGQEMVLDDDTGERGGLLEELGEELGPMPEEEMQAIAADLKARYGLRTRHDADQLD